MSSITKTAFCLTLATSLIWSAGCRKEPAAAPPAAAPSAPAAKPAEQPAAEQPQADASEAAKIEAAFASLSAEDRAGDPAKDLSGERRSTRRDGHADQGQRRGP